VKIMDVKEAVSIAKNYVSNLFADENISDLGLEEVEFDDRNDQWRVTIGFARPWDKNALSEMMMKGSAFRRSYKVVAINQDGSVASVKDRRLQAVA
jgi:hypothetical protein